jgi:hypothetical protein
LNQKFECKYFSIPATDPEAFQPRRLMIRKDPLSGR